MAVGKIFIKFTGKVIFCLNNLKDVQELWYRYLKALFGFMLDMNVQPEKLEKHVEHRC